MELFLYDGIVPWNLAMEQMASLDGNQKPVSTTRHGVSQQEQEQQRTRQNTLL